MKLNTGQTIRHAWFVIAMRCQRAGLSSRYLPAGINSSLFCLRSLCHLFGLFRISGLEFTGSFGNPPDTRLRSVEKEKRGYS